MSRFYNRSGFRSNYRSFRSGKFSYRGRGSRFGRKGGAWFNRNGRSAKNQTQYTNTQINLTEFSNITIPFTVDPLDITYAGNTFNPLGSLQASAMHAALTNTYDQMKIRKVVCKVTPIISPGSDAEGDNRYFNIYSAVDRTGFDAAVTPQQLQSYQSYKSTPYSFVTSNLIKPHYIVVSQNTMLSKTAWYDSKQQYAFPQIFVGAFGDVQADGGGTVRMQLDWTFDISYRGLRYDNRALSTNIAQPSD